MSAGRSIAPVITGRHTKKATHGESRRGKVSAEYRIWSGMHNRCSNPKNSSFSRYGGRGISVCKRWGDFQNFLTDMGRRPSSLHSLDRWPDNDGDYKAGNCRWATEKQQSLNRRNNVLVALGGARIPLKQASEKLDINYDMVLSRIYRGASPQAALAPRLSKAELSRRLSVTVARGSNAGPAKLKESDILVIRSDPRPQSAIARDYGVSQGAIQAIKARRNWRHIP